jgi:hypothetical protein
MRVAELAGVVTMGAGVRLQCAWSVPGVAGARGFREKGLARLVVTLRVQAADHCLRMQKCAFVEQLLWIIV